MEAVRSTILAGANVNDKNKGGWTPLHLAAKRGHSEIIKILVDAGADLSMSNQLKQQGLFGEDYEGDSPVDLADRYGHGETRKLLINETANLLINTGADLNSKNANGWTLLHWAARYGYVDVVRNLINARADVNNKKKDGWTPLHLAVHNRHIDIARNLIDAGADVNDKNKGGWTPLHLAVKNGYVDVARNLIDSGADVNDRNDKTITITETDSYIVKSESGYESRETITKSEDYTIKQTPLYLAFKND